MRYVKSGNGEMPLISLIAILAISMTINLPGLAVSPMLSRLHHIFNTSELESQLITSLPNLVMIPVVLIAGKLSTPSRQTAILTTGLSIFLAAGIVSLFADSIGMLIILGCFCGIGCGLVVPIAAGYISEWFSGVPRQQDLGFKSTVSNSMVIIANVYVGWIAARNWHAAFAVYLIPLVPLCLVPFMTQRFISRHRETATSTPSQTTAQAPAQKHFKGRESLMLLISIIVLYIFLTYSTTCISYYAPFMMDKYGMSTAQAGVVTAAYYLMVAVSGAAVGWLKKLFGWPVIFISLALCAAGLFVIGFTKSYLVMIIFSLITGFGYGIIQPIIYNKTTYIAPTPKQGMTYFGYVLSANYLAIMMVPFVNGFFRHLFKATAPGFEFILSGIVVTFILIWAILAHRNYIFNIRGGLRVKG